MVASKTTGPLMDIDICLFRGNIMQFINYCLLIKATNEVISNVPKATQDEMNAAVDSASKAFESWSHTSILSRQQILFAYQGLIKSNMVRSSTHPAHHIFSQPNQCLWCYICSIFTKSFLFCFL